MAEDSQVAYSNGYENGKSASAAELSRLQAEIAEAREIIAEFYGSSDEMLKLFEGISNEDAPRHGLEMDYVNLDTFRRARAFLKRSDKTESGDA